MSINNKGVVAGSIDSNVQYVLGFELAGSKCITFAPVKTLETYVYGISMSNTLIGYAANETGTVIGNFAYAHGKSKQLVIPDAPNAEVLGINPAGNILVGSYTSPSGGTAGFVYQDRTLTTLLFPGSNDTYATGVNSAGEVVGGFLDSSGFEHGFTWTPSGNTRQQPSTPGH